MLNFFGWDCRTHFPDLDITFFHPRNLCDYLDDTSLGIGTHVTINMLKDPASDETSLVVFAPTKGNNITLFRTGVELAIDVE